MKIPPFSKPLKALLESGYKPNNDIYLYTGIKAWEKGKSSSICRPTRTLVLPPFDRPNQYSWPIQGCDILFHDTGGSPEEYIELTAFYLLEYGAEIIRCISMDYSYFATYKKDL